MHRFLKIISFVFHPLIMPLLGVVFYFSKSPRYLPSPIIQAKLVSLFILTVLLPLLVYQLLKTIGKVNTIYLSDVKERVLPLAINCLILLIVIKKVLPYYEITELYFFFIGILFSNMACLILAVLHFKASIHMIAVSGIFMFFVALSIHFSINILGSLALIILIAGAVATSRLHLKAHSVRELIIGCCIGVLPQLILLNYWL